MHSQNTTIPLHYLGLRKHAIMECLTCGFSNDDNAIMILFLESESVYLPKKEK